MIWPLVGLFLSRLLVFSRFLLVLLGFFLFSSPLSRFGLFYNFFCPVFSYLPLSASSSCLLPCLSYTVQSSIDLRHFFSSLVFFCFVFSSFFFGLNGLLLLPCFSQVFSHSAFWWRLMYTRLTHPAFMFLSAAHIYVPLSLLLAHTL